MNNIKIEEVHISKIKRGDTVIHDGEMKTVCASNIKGPDFMGVSLWGDCYKSGTVLVKKKCLIHLKRIVLKLLRQ